MLVLAALCAGTATAATEGERAVAAVGERMRADDCAGVVSRLNAGMKNGYPELALLAGTMFENGFCVGRNWDKAVSLYASAAEGGVVEGALRLAAGYADPANGPDAAAALWWARRAGLDAGWCTTKLPKAGEPEAFVEALGKWPSHDLEVCTHVVGMLSFIRADVRFPVKGVKREAVGQLEVEYWPGTGKVRSEAPGMHYTGGLAIHDVFTHSLSLARARYKPPVGIDRDWVIPMVLRIDSDKSHWW